MEENPQQHCWVLPWEVMEGIPVNAPAPVSKAGPVWLVVVTLCCLSADLELGWLPGCLWASLRHQQAIS